jgi:hypothetical protein
MDKELQHLTDTELAELRAGYDRQQAAAKARGDSGTVREMRAKKLEIQREIDRRHKTQKLPPAAHMIGGAGDIQSKEKVDGLGG